MILYAFTLCLYWVLLCAKILIYCLLQMIPQLYSITWSMKTSKHPQIWSTDFFKGRHGICVQINVLLHELYPLKDPSKVTSPDHQLELSSQDFIQALRKMDLEDNTTEDLEEVNFLFDTNHLPLSSFSPVCPSHRPKPGPSTHTASTLDEDPLSQNSLPPPLDSWWLLDDKASIQQVITPTSSSILSSPGSEQSSPELSELAEDSARMVSAHDNVYPPQLTVTSIKREDIAENNGHCASLVNANEGCLRDTSDEANRSIVTNQTSTLAVPPVQTFSSGHCVTGNQRAIRQRTVSKSCYYNANSFSIPDFDRSMSSLASSSSDSEVDYRAETIQSKPKAFTNNRKIECDSLTLSSLSPKADDQDRRSCTSSLDSVALSRWHPSTTYSSVSAKSDHHLRDMDTFLRAKIPFSYEEVIHASNELFREMRASHDLTNHQINIMLDVRKRAANRLAAERCRRLKIATRDELAEQLASLRLERQLLQRQVAQARQRKQKASDSLMDEQKRVLLLLRDADGGQLKYTDWRVRLTHDDEIIVVAAGR